MPSIRVVVKPTAGGDKLNVDIEPSITVLELKEELAKQCSITAPEQRLIYKGQILKDERSVESYGIENDHVVHLVKGKPPGGSSSTTASSAVAASPSPAAPAAVGPVPGLPTGLGAMLGQGGNQQQEWQQMQQMLNTPMMQSMMQSVMNNPELLRTVLQSNPEVRQIMERNPDIAQLLNNPSLIRESLNIASNPSLLREHMRHSDRAMSNLETHPEGFNTLRRLYENLQEPLQNAASNPDLSSFPASLLGGFNGQQPSAQSGTAQPGATPAGPAPNSNPLPNPWAPSAADPSAQTTGSPASHGMVPAGLGAGLGGLGGFGPAGMPPGMDMSTVLNMMNNPVMQQMTQTMLSSPGFVENMLNMNPQMRMLAEANPMFREQLSNPDTIRQMLQPENLQAIMSMQQAMQQLQGSNLFPGLFGDAAAGGGAAGAGATPDLNAMLAALGGGMPGMGLPGMGLPGLGAQPAGSPEVAYASQLQQLQDMGFPDRDANIRALQAVGGNVHAAVDRLLQGI